MPNTTPSIARVPSSAFALLGLMTAILAGCGGGGGSNSPPVATAPAPTAAAPTPAPAPPAPAAAAPLTAVAKVASCQTGDTPETGLQGQVPAALRASGFHGFSCNLKMVGQLQGEGGDWSAATVRDQTGHRCAYYATAYPTDGSGNSRGRVNPGVPVIDITNAAAPVRTTSLTTDAMLDPWESLRVSPTRLVLAADDGRNGSGNSEVDFYDVSSNCTSPQLLSSSLVGTGADGGITPAQTPNGHEGNFAPDGLTYYIGSLFTSSYYAVDATDLTHPKVIAEFSNAGTPQGKAAAAYVTAGTPVLLGGTSHGLSISEDGTRGYFTVIGGPPTLAALADPTAPNTNGFNIVDLSQVQARTPNAQIPLIASVSYKNGSVAQHTIPVTIAGKAYLIMVDEAGSGGLYSDAEAKAACAANLPVYPMARIFDISDETKPVEVSTMMLETHLPQNCAAVLPDVTGLNTFTYGSHYCSVDNRQNATALACGYFNSGIRVFDIRVPTTPKEIAYYNPAGATTAVPGSQHVATGNWKSGGPDWCDSRIDFDFDSAELTTMCQDNGLLVLQFEGKAWPFPESTPTTEQTN